MPIDLACGARKLPSLCVDYNSRYVVRRAGIPMPAMRGVRNNVNPPAFAPAFRGEYNVAVPIDPQAQALFPRVYDIVRQVPYGKVTTYGDVAALVGQGCDARIAGYAMAACPDDVPWQRVINAQGKISLQGDNAAKQRMRLEAEGIEFDQRGRIDLKRYRWAGPHGEFAPSQPSLFE